MLIKILILAVLIAIIISLGSGLFFLVKDKDAKSKRMANSLTVRIVLSIALFFLLIIAYQQGLIQPHSALRVQPDAAAPAP
ncbi:MAG: twin transmembrane helix small protein [Gammaproteobacteria bacterium]|nr:twin transmembrane helix small protein [Gammaproteobacteria bacterium]